MADESPTIAAEGATETLSRWDGLSTGLKMWIILSVGLLPLGIIAIAASIDNARINRAKADVEAQALLTIHMQRLTTALTRNSFTIRAARDAIMAVGDVDRICEATLARLDHFPNTPGRFVMFGRSPQTRCASPGFAPPPRPAWNGLTGRPFILPGGEIFRIFMYDRAGAPEGIAEYDRVKLAAIIDSAMPNRDFGLDLVQGGRTMPLRALSEAGARRRLIELTQPFQTGQYAMHIRMAAPPPSLSEILVILTPVLMWLWASLVGWILVQRLLLLPLRRIEDVVAAYRPGDRGLALPTLRTPALEIGALGRAFARMTQTVAGHEADLESAVMRQTRLVREVHHRVKNNLQVVASLLNLHARGARSDEVAAAYASIQRRVDALAVVHRNHFAELEENRGVALRPLISELAANLRATAPPVAAGMQIRLDIGSFSVTQDVAVSVAFLITEIAEFGMLCGAGLVSITLDADGEGGARLEIAVDALAGTVDCDETLADRFDRIITGLARQLRSTLERDPDRGLYAVRLAVIERDV